MNDVGSVDQATSNVQYHSVHSEEVEAEAPKPKNIWKREVSYLHPLLADENEEDLDHEHMADTTKVATYSQLFAALLFPFVVVSFVVVSFFMHFFLVIGIPLAIRSLKRYSLAFEGYTAAHKEQRKVKSLTFLAFRGLFLLPYSVWFLGLAFFLPVPALSLREHHVISDVGRCCDFQGKWRQDSSSFEFKSCWIHLFLELPCLDLRSTLVRVAFHDSFKGKFSPLSKSGNGVFIFFCGWACASSAVDHH